jgi:hypothetical protein
MRRDLPRTRLIGDQEPQTHRRRCAFSLAIGSRNVVVESKNQLVILLYSIDTVVLIM